MIDARKPNYDDTVFQIEQLKSLIEKLDKNVSFQLPQGINKEYIDKKNIFMNWVEEIEYTLGNYKKEI